ncbi:hypothetical protein GCM10009853_079260 [Glycomyces scopariae]
MPKVTMLRIQTANGPRVFSSGMGHCSLRTGETGLDDSARLRDASRSRLGSLAEVRSH